MFLRMLIVLIATGCHLSLSAQDSIYTLTLDECLDLAVANNIELQRSRNDLILAKSNKTQALANFLPSLEASAFYDINQGANFDNNSGKFVTSVLRSSRPSLSSNLLLFNAFSNHHLLNRREHELQSTLYNVNEIEINTKAQVLVLFLNVILDYERKQNAEKRLDLLRSQLEREEKRASVGVGNLETVVNFRSQVANEELNLVLIDNTLRTDRLLLAQALRVPVGIDFQLKYEEFQSLDMNELAIDEFDEVLSDILENSFRLKSSEEDLLATNYLVKQSKSALYPSLSLYGQVGSRYSNQNEGEYFNQLQNLGYQQIGLALNFPIFNRFSGKTRVDQASVALLNSELNYQQDLLEVTNSVQSDYLDLVSSVASYKAANLNLEAQNQSFQFIKKRFETGSTDFYTYLETLNNVNRAEMELITARYSVIFRQKVLNLYRLQSN